MQYMHCKWGYSFQVVGLITWIEGMRDRAMEGGRGGEGGSGRGREGGSRREGERGRRREKERERPHFCNELFSLR